MKIILASNSPRRKELLAAIETDFEVRTLQGIDETYPQGLTMTGIPEHISSHKAAAYALGEDELLIAADTIVYLEGEVIGKFGGSGEGKEADGDADAADQKQNSADVEDHVVCIDRAADALQMLHRKDVFRGLSEGDPKEDGQKDLNDRQAAA